MACHAARGVDEVLMRSDKSGEVTFLSHLSTHSSTLGHSFFIIMVFRLLIRKEEKDNGVD